MTPLEAYTYFTTVTGPLAIISAIVCGLAVILSYVFPSQRRFPNIVLVWTCVADTVLAIYLAMKWFDGPVKRKLTDSIEAGTMACRVSIYVEMLLEMNSSIICVIVTFTLYLTIVKHMDVAEIKQKYYTRFMVAIWVGSLGFPALTFTNDFKAQGVGICTLSSEIGFCLQIVPWILLFAVQLRYIAPVCVYVCKVKRRISAHMRSNTGAQVQLWLYARFLCIFVNQLAMWFDVLLYDIFTILKIPLADVHVYLLGATPILLSVNGLIVITGNKNLRDALVASKTAFYSKFKQSNSLSKGQSAVSLDSIAVSDASLIESKGTSNDISRK